MTAAELQQYQLQFCGHIRDPQSNPRPAGVKAKHMQIYARLVFNNLESSLAACFPVAKGALGIRAWKRLVRAFLAQHRSRSPIFREIPEEFLTFLQTAEDLPPYLHSLAHYEWMELAISALDAPLDMRQVDAGGDLLDAQPVFAPALALLSYHYPVHKISARFRPARPLAQPVHLLIFRDVDEDVRFIELNSVTARLVDILKAGALTCRQALEQVAVELDHPDMQAIIGFGLEILASLRQQGAILGCRR